MVAGVEVRYNRLGRGLPVLGSGRVGLCGENSDWVGREEESVLASLQKLEYLRYLNTRV